MTNGKDAVPVAIVSHHKQVGACFPACLSSSRSFNAYSAPHIHFICQLWVQGQWNGALRRPSKLTRRPNLALFQHNLCQ